MSCEVPELFTFLLNFLVLFAAKKSTLCIFNNIYLELGNISAYSWTEEKEIQKFE